MTHPSEELAPAAEHDRLTSRAATSYFSSIDKELQLARVLTRPVRVTWVLLLVNVVFYVAAWVYGELVMHQGLGLSTDVLNVGQLSFYTGMKLAPAIWERGQWWRLISSAFVHMDLMHILFNAYGLYAIGPLIERFYGRTRFVILYFGSAILSALASLVFSDAASGGASGALYGLVGAMLVLGFKYRAVLPQRLSHALTRGMLPWVVFGIGIGFFDFMPMDNAAHIGGVVSGGVLALLMRSAVAAKLAQEKQKKRDTVAGVIAASLLVLSLVSAVFWGLEVEQCSASSEAYLACYPELVTEVMPADTLDVPTMNPY